MREVMPLICSVARRTESFEARSSVTILTSTSGWSSAISSTTGWIFDLFRPAEMRRLGPALAKELAT